MPWAFGFCPFRANSIAQLQKSQARLRLFPRLRFDDQAADEGIFFLPAAGGSAVKVAAVLDNKPSQLSFQVPAAVIADQWFVQVRARAENSTALRSGQLDTVLTVSV